MITRRLVTGMTVVTVLSRTLWTRPADAQRRGGGNGGKSRGSGGGATAVPRGQAGPRTPSGGGSSHGGSPSGGQSRGGPSHGGPVYGPGHGGGSNVYLSSRWYGGGPSYSWGWGFGWGGWPWWYYPTFPYHPYPYPSPYYYDYDYAAASVRVQVDQKHAEVYVDGRLAGMVDDFDGFFQRLQVEPGGRDITVYEEGFRPHSERLYLSAWQSYSIRHVMEPLAPGEPNAPRPFAPPVTTQQEPWGVQARPGLAEPGQEPPAVVPGLPAGPPPDAPPAPVPGNFGQVAIRVQPGDAQVLIDDEPWQGSQGADRLVVHLRPGTHRVEIRKPGFDPFVTSVDIKRGESVVLNVSLGRVSGV